MINNFSGVFISFDFLLSYLSWEEKGAAYCYAGKFQQYSKIFFPHDIYELIEC